jgi:hypothetical protein
MENIKKTLIKNLLTLSPQNFIEINNLQGPSFSDMMVEETKKKIGNLSLRVLVPYIIP